MNKFTPETSQETDEFDLQDIVYKYAQHWKWFIVSIVLCCFIGAFAYLSSDRKYNISTSVLLKEEKGGMKAGGPLGNLQELGILSTTNNVDNEIAVFSSPNLMKQVVESLELQTQYFQKNFFRDDEVYNDCPYYVSLPDIKMDALKGVLVLTVKQLGSEYVVKGEYLESKEKTKIEETLKELPAYISLPKGGGRLFITLRPQYKEELVEENTYKIVIQSSLRVAYALAQEIAVTSTTKQSSVLSISMKSRNVVKGIDLMKELVVIYNKNNVEDANEMSSNTSKFIDERIKSIAVELEDVEDLVETYKKDKKITDIGTEARVFVEETSDMEKKRTEVITQLKTLELIESFINDSKNDFKIIPTLGILDKGLVEVISEYNSLLLSYDRLVRSTTEDNPSRKNLYRQLSTTMSSIKSSVNNVKNAILLSKSEIDRRYAAISSRIVSVPTQERGLLEITRQQNVKQSLYLFLMKAKEETSITMASTSDKAKVITDPIIPDRAVSPKLTMIFLVALLFGVVAPIVIIYVVDLLKVSISSREELERLSRIPVIGEISKKQEESVIVVEKNKTTPIVELFRALRNKIKFILNDDTKKVLLITSTIPGEGKTFVSINLAASFALSDKKVLLVGLDVRNPKLATDLNFKKGPGVTSYLSGSDTDWKSMLIKLDNYSNLDVLQAGVIPPNPNELLMTSALEKLLQEARAIYDIVILDTAPVGVVSDTFLISKYVDASIYVTRENVTPKNAASFFNQAYADEALPNMYLVLNGVELTKNKARQGRYGYGYSYGYGERK